MCCAKVYTRYSRRASSLVLVVMVIAILSLLGTGLYTLAYGVRHRAITIKNEAVAMLAAEAGYERAVFWMTQQMDMITALYQGAAGSSGVLNFPDSYCDYNITLHSFTGYRPVYRVVSNGHSGEFNRTVDVLVVQAISGWDMGMCRVPLSSYSTTPVNFADDEIINMPLHINNFHDNPDKIDIHISGSPTFLKEVAMGESKGSKYSDSTMMLFDGGIYFDQPDCKVMDGLTVASKVERFKNSTKEQYKFTPTDNTSVINHMPAVHLEFFVQGGIGKVRITNNCTVRGYKESSDSYTYDFKVKPGSGGTQYERYYIYAYHLRPYDVGIDYRIVCNIEDTYVTQSIGGIESEPGGQIFVDGSVIIGSGDPALPTQDVIKGRVTVVATGNIWIADSLIADGTHDANGMPADDNPNILGLIAQGVVKVVDAGMSENVTIIQPTGYKYVPIGLADSGQPADSYHRHLPDPLVVEAAITVGGGGWGAENVCRCANMYCSACYGKTGRKETGSGSQDYLIVRGTITETVRGVVGLVDNDGYIKHYYFDERLLDGILPGDIWLRGKYVSAPAGWHDYRAGY